VTKSRIRRILQESLAVKQALLTQVDTIERIADSLIETLREGHKVLVCGNGGSAADAQHMAGELVGQFMLHRPPYRVLALTTNSSIITALANDYGYDAVFARQVEAFVEPGDLLFAISTSGNSPNIIKAVEIAKARNAAVIGLSGEGGGGLKDMADICLCVHAQTSPRIQEAHITVIHILCALIEESLSKAATSL